MARSGEERVACDHVVPAIHNVDGIEFSAATVDAAKEFIRRNHVSDRSVTAVVTDNVDVCLVVVAKLIADEYAVVGGNRGCAVQGQTITMIAAEVRMFDPDARRTIQFHPASAIVFKF